MTIATDFVPMAIDATQWEAIEPYVTSLLERPVADGAELEQWLRDRSELDAACSQSRAELYIDMTCHTDQQDIQDAYTRFVENVAPHLANAAFKLDQRQKALTDEIELDESRYGVLVRDTVADVEIFREANVPIQTELDKLSQTYDQIVGAMTVEFEGREQTLPQMARYQESTDRALRERAWRVVADRRLTDAERIDAIFDEMIARRHQMALNSDCDDYIGYAFKKMHRFDYTPADCVQFHESVESIIVPLMRRIDADRAGAMSVDPLRPWDLTVDPLGRDPLAPFEDGQDLIERSRNVFARLDPALARLFVSLGDNSDKGRREGNFDLDSRKGKAPGGYQYVRDRTRIPFIFMNAAGLHRDVETMVHESGHAFHSQLCADDPLVHYRHSPIEFAEVASMSMELLTMPYWDEFYDDPTDLARARRRQVEGSVVLLPWIATIDAFQHWLYANPDHTRDQRTGAWLDLQKRFGNAVSWEGLEHVLPKVWQRQAHLFSVPFYYIEYGIAQLGALQLWSISLEKGEDVAVEHYKRALAIGGSRPLPELFEAAQIRFDFGSDTIGRLANHVSNELDRLPA
jgi:oligoendopeptidase F